MKSFLQLLEEHKKSLAMLFGRMNPPTKGHEENVEGLKKMAAEHGADHLVVASHSHDASKNPLDAATKLKHLKRAFPDTNVTTSSKEQPTIMHQAAEAHKKGYTHLIVAGGGDRVKEYHHLLNKYNGVEGRHGYYKFDKIEVKSTGERKAGISGTDMRNHVKSGNFKEFKKNLPKHIAKSQVHSTELFHDVAKGMGLHEGVDHGNYKAIFVTGGPGSGKDIVIRECIAEEGIVELNFNQAFDILADKAKLTQKNEDFRLQAVRSRGPLIINGPADDYDRISYIKEELEELGYDTMMVFVETTDDSSKQRSMQHAKVMLEAVRFDKWTKSQRNVMKFKEMFETFVQFENNDELDYMVDEISTVFEATSSFLDTAPTVKITPAPRVPRFRTDKETQKKSNGMTGTQKPGTLMRPAGLGPELSTRGSGTIFPMSGLGNATYSESRNFGSFRQKLKEATDATDMGTVQSTDKEPVQSYKDQERNLGFQDKKKKENRR